MVRLTMVPFLTLAGFFATACVIAPTDGATVASRATPIVVSGYSYGAQATIEIYARDMVAGGAWKRVATTTSGATPLESNTLYGFSKTITLANKYWDPSGTCDGSSSGMAQLKVREINGPDQFATFTASGKDCLTPEYQSTGSWVTAGQNCTTGNTVTLTTFHCN